MSPGGVDMTSRERVFEVLAGHSVDRLPFMPITMMFAADILGVKYRRYATEYRVLAEAQVLVAEQFATDHVSAISDPVREAADRGAAVNWFEDQPPAIVEDDPLLVEPNDLTRLIDSDPGIGPRMEDRIKGVELLKQSAGKWLVIEGWVEGPCAEAADLRGLTNLMTDFYDEPEFVEELLDYCVQGATVFAVAQLKAGADIIGIGDAAASLVGPVLYREAVWKWEKKLIESIHSFGGKVRLHICGNTRAILGEMGELGADFVDLDYPVSLDEARRAMGPGQVLAGNLDPVREVRNGNPLGIKKLLGERHRQAGDPWIVAAGCEIVRDTPHANLMAMSEFARVSHGLAMH